MDVEVALKEFRNFQSYLLDLRKEVILYEQLFCEENSRRVLNKELGEVFGILQRSMFFSIVTRIAAIMDRAQFDNNSNLSIEFIKEKYSKYFTGKVADHYSKVITAYKSLGIKKYRHKLIAHRDYDAILGSAPPAHAIYDGVLTVFLDEIRHLCIALAKAMPGGIENVLQIEPLHLQPGRDGLELVRRVAPK